MSNKTLYSLVFLVLVGIGVMFFINLLPVLKSDNAEKFIRLNDIKGMAVVYKGKEYTFNFDQQNEIAILLNQSVPFENGNIKNPDLVPFEKIIIYRFNGTDLIVTPVGFKGRNLVYTVPEWNSGNYLKEISDGTLKDIIESAYPA